jgi:hypothetical protein
MKKAGIAAFVAAIVVSGAARAEVLEITGEFAAPNREASFLASIAVERFGGSDGPALAIAIERALTGSQIEVLAGRAGRDRAEGSVTGSVTSGVDEQPYTRQEKKCVEKDAKGKCVKEETVDVRCRRRIVNVNADIRIARNTDGRIVYSAAKPFREEVSWCAGGSASRTAEETIASAIRDIAGSVRAEITPRVDTYRIRVRESTKGMPKDLGNRFKELVKRTKRDARGACAGWDAIRAEAGAHPSLLFNLGLCAEQRGDYEAALGLYRDAVAAGAGEGNAGRGRVEQLIAGREDARERERRRRG